jgi:hypothetical protein
MSDGEIVLYNTEDGLARVQLRAADGTVWLTQAQIAELFDTTKQNVSLHLRNLLTERELAEASVVKESLTTAADGTGRPRRRQADRTRAIRGIRYGASHGRGACGGYRARRGNASPNGRA